MTETQTVEHKQHLDLGNPKARLKLVREIVAMANTAGGAIHIGVADDGGRVGIDEADLSKWDPASIGDLLDPFVAPDHLEVDVRPSSEGCPDGRVVILLGVAAVPDPPIVMARDGNLEGEKAIFRKGDVLVRHNTKVERARRVDFIAWRERLRSRILQQFQMVVEAPESSRLRIVGSDEVRDEASFMLSRAVDLFGSRPEKLLDASDLLYLFDHRDVLDLDDPVAVELLIQSALRRRATLFFWLGLAEPDVPTMDGILNKALDMRDRDKSDMGGAIPLVAALYLDVTSYDSLIQRMAGSSYSHIRDAAGEYPDRSVAMKKIADKRGATVDGHVLEDLHADGLLSLADEIASSENPPTISRRLPQVGLEFLIRRLDRDDSESARP